jgi:hypothetical protein
MEECNFNKLGSCATVGMRLRKAPSSIIGSKIFNPGLNHGEGEGEGEMKTKAKIKFKRLFNQVKPDDEDDDEEEEFDDDAVKPS